MRFFGKKTDRKAMPTGILFHFYRYLSFARIDREAREACSFPRDVLVGSLRNPQQLPVCLENNFYHVPAQLVGKQNLPIRYVAIYQSMRFYGDKGGIYYWGQVSKCSRVPRYTIPWIPRHSAQPYYLFEIKQWLPLIHPVMPKEIPVSAPIFTNRYLLEHSRELPELLTDTLDTYKLYHKLKWLVEHNVSEKPMSLRMGDKRLTVTGEQIALWQGLNLLTIHAVAAYQETPYRVFLDIFRHIHPS